MAGLMWGPARDESATVDEPLVLATGYLFSTGNGCQLNPEHPPLGQLLPALPWLVLDVQLSEQLRALAELRVAAPFARPWNGWQAGKPEDFYPQGQQSWYYWPYWEGGILAGELLYDGQNDADKLLRVSRAVQIALTLLTGLVIVGWLRKAAGMTAALLGLALWVFNPVALAHGHLATTDIGVTLTMTLALWAFVALLEKPSGQTALLTGLATGLALVMKFSALLLAPMFAAVAVGFLWCRRESGREAWRFWKWIPLATLVIWLVILLVYAPHWQPAPALMADDAKKIGVPGWFQTLRVVLIPADFFKGIALQAQHTAIGHEAFLRGEWRTTGWWYYFPLALAWKLPVPLLTLSLATLVAWLVRARHWSIAEAAPWFAALTFLAVAMTSSINIGVRYLLPILPLIAIGTALQIARAKLFGRVMALIACVWLAVASAFAYPFYIEYCNEFIGGTANGYRYLVDSNYDWGQDTKRLRDWLAARGNPPIKLRFAGGLKVARYYGINCEPVTPATRSGLLVISATELMRQDWDELRRHSQPIARVGHTLFVYDLTNR